MTIKNRTQLKILLLQIREDPITQKEELQEFIKFAELAPHQLDVLNVFDQINFKPQVIDDYDALFIGGSSDASVQDPITYPFLPSCYGLIRHCYNKNLPVLASCFGFQLAINEFGGEVIVDKDNMEMGLFEIKLTPAAKHDQLLYDMPDTFWAVSGHKERATCLPEDAILLGSTPLCPYHIFTFKDKDFYGFQFHPEVDTKDLTKRITRYQSRYLAHSDTLDKIIASAIHPTTQSNAIIKKFIDRILLE